MCFPAPPHLINLFLSSRKAFALGLSVWQERVLLTFAAHILKLTRKGSLAATPRGGGGELGGSLRTARDGVGVEARRSARGEGARSLGVGIWLEQALGLSLGSSGQPQAYLGSGYTGPELSGKLCIVTSSQARRAAPKARGPNRPRVYYGPSFYLLEKKSD